MIYNFKNDTLFFNRYLLPKKTLLARLSSAARNSAYPV